MALTNAQRQERYRQSLKAKAQGVTPDMVEQAARMLFEVDKAADSPSWEDWVAKCRKRGNSDMWRQLWIADDDDTLLLEAVAESGGDAELVGRVLAVARAVMYPAQKLPF